MRTARSGLVPRARGRTRDLNVVAPMRTRRPTNENARARELDTEEEASATPSSTSPIDDAVLLGETVATVPACGDGRCTDTDASGATIKLKLPRVGCPSDAAVLHETIYRPGGRDSETRRETPSGVPCSAAGAPNANARPLASVSETDVIRSSGCSENHRRINCGEAAIVEPAAGSLRLRRACAHARTGHNTRTSATARRTPLLTISLHLHSTHLVLVHRGFT